MALSSRGIWALGLSLAGVAYLVGPSLGQGQQQADVAVRKAGNSGTAATATGPKPPVPPLIGTIDMDVIFKNYEKVKASQKDFHDAMQVRRAELMKIENEARNEAEMMSKMTPGTEDYRKRENHITELKARMEAGREQAEREFTLKNAEMVATWYKEIQAMVARVAQWRGMTYVVQVSSAPINGTEPNSVIAAINRPVVYADPRNDITHDVVHYLNRMYKATAGPAAATPKAGGRALGAGGASESARPGEN
jgi:outer membrane protein